MPIRKFSKFEYWNLFLMCALPIHIWNFVLLIRDSDWVVDQFGADVFTGYAAYSMVFAFGESLLYFLSIILIGTLLPKRWDKQITLTTLSILGVIILLWAIINQLYFLLLNSSPAWFEWIRIRVYYNQDWVFILLVLIIFASIGLPIVIVERNQKLKTILLSAIDRLSMLSILYLLLDLIGAVISIYRNI